MIHRRRPLGWMGVIALACAGDAGAQQAARPIRPLDHIVASTTDSLGIIRGARQLSDGRVLVNDGGHSELILYDASLRRLRVVADTNVETSKAYGAGTGDILRARGDTTLFLDWSSRAFVTVLPNGTLGKIVAVPPLSELGYLGLSHRNGTAGFDGRGRLIFRSGARCHSPPGSADGKDSGPVGDSAALVRADMVTRQIDTIACYKEFVPKRGSPGFTLPLPNGDRIVIAPTIIDPFPISDDWAILSDGSLAIIRSHDYHIDWIDPDGTTRSTPPMPFHWDRITDSAKTAIIDSLRAHADSVTYGKVKGPPQQYVDAADLPDYRAPFRPNGAVGDGDAHVWIQVALMPQPEGGPVYDVVDRTGTVIDRVQVPGDTFIVGFGPGVVYLSSRDGARYSLVKVALDWKR
ncbi:MAG TPA: hypothetical protein VMH39_09575 [Gemmatimonadaceae bacterium]|nr:hypothetical protein [Gemmatimonadaceae bacterium]